MKSTPVIESKTNMSMIWLLAIGGILMMTLGLYLILLQNNSVKHDDDWILNIIGIPFFVLGLYSIYAILNHDKLKISNKVLTIESIFGTTKNEIDLKKVRSYTEISKQNMKFRHELAHMAWRDLTIINDEMSYRISSNTYKNYEEIKISITRGIKRNNFLEKEWLRKNNLKFGIGLSVFGPMFCLFLYGNGMRISSEEYLPASILFIFLLFPTLVGVNILRNNLKPTDNKVP